MQTRHQALHDLVMESQYSIDPDLVAGAIVARAVARRLVVDAHIRNELGPGERAGGVTNVMGAANVGQPGPIIRPEAIDPGQGPGWQPDVWG